MNVFCSTYSFPDPNGGGPFNCQVGEVLQLKTNCNRYQFPTEGREEIPATIHFPHDLPSSDFRLRRMLKLFFDVCPTSSAQYVFSVVVVSIL